MWHIQLYIGPSTCHLGLSSGVAVRINLFAIIKYMFNYSLKGQRTIYLFPVYKAFLIYHMSLLPMTCLQSGIKILELQGTYRPCGPAKMRSDS